MGLDQFAYKTKVKPGKSVDFQDEVYKDEVEHEEIHYWRKHPNIHGFMEELYREKGGESEFNCRPVELTQEDIDRLAESILGEELPETSGFFFGQSYGNEEEENDDLEFCKKASEAIKEGYTVFYDSWW
jgi:hypothetical protein